MIELEKLYESAGRHLSCSPQQWESFSAEFKKNFCADMVIYHPTFVKGVLAWRSDKQTIATTNPQYAREYVKQRIFESNKIPDDSLNPLEPSRRSDVIPDDVYLETDVAKEFFIPRDIFYMLAVSAILPDNSSLMMVAWRSKGAGDFSDLEKQRIALFMRYLATLIAVDKKEKVAPSIEGIGDFGKRYALTSSEVNVLSALLQGKSLKDIASESGRSYSTVRWHVQNILEKCQVKSQKNLLSEFYRLIKR